jgi:hypothetical protein
MGQRGWTAAGNAAAAAAAAAAALAALVGKHAQKRAKTETWLAQVGMPHVAP